MIKSNPIPVRWLTLRQENNNTKEVLTLLWMFWTPCQAFQPGDVTKGLGIPRESGFGGQWGLIIGLPEDWEKQRLQSWRTHTKFCAHQDPEERSIDPIGDWNKTTCQCWRPPVEVWITRGSPEGWGTGRALLASTILEFAINPTTDPRAGSPQAKQLPGRKCNPTHQQKIGLKLYWARPSTSEQDPVFPTTSPSHQEVLHKPLSHICQRADRRSKKRHSLTAAKTKTILQKVTTMKK